MKRTSLKTLIDASTQSKHYRPEIDGLRAWAVLSVIFFHLNIKFNGSPIFEGGYLGVDIFFVISGYLISKIIFQQFDSKKFTYQDFYSRRIRRILPTYFIVILSSLPFAYYYLSKFQLKEFSESALSSLIFSSNLFFWLADSYFAESNELRPLMHLWSLSVEEQFYLIFPLAAVFLVKLPKKIILVSLASLFCISFFISNSHRMEVDSFSFYWFHTRAWEILAGSIVAFVELKFKPKPSEKTLNIISVISLILIFYPVFLFDHSTPHPSHFTFFPVLGVALFLQFCHSGQLPIKIFTTLPVRFVGLISYSLYLWHQPVLAFYRNAIQREMLGMEKLFALTLIIFLSILSWRFIENPFRNKNIINSYKVRIFCLLSTLFIIAFGYFFGVNVKLDPAVLKGGQSFYEVGNIRVDFTSGRLIKHPINKNCVETQKIEPCILSKIKDEYWYILGDSHASQLEAPVRDLLKEYNKTVISLANDGCYYVPGMLLRLSGGFSYCNHIFNNKRRDLLLKGKKGVVVIVGRFPLFLNLSSFDNQEGGIEKEHIHLFQVPGQNLSDEKNIEIFKNTVRSSIQELIEVGHRVILIYPIPEVGTHVPNSVRQKLKGFSEEEGLEWLDKKGVTTSYELFKKRNKEAYELLDSIGSFPGLVRVYPEKFLCDPEIQRCKTNDQQELFYEDDDHITYSIAKKILKKSILEVLSKQEKD